MVFSSLLLALGLTSMLLWTVSKPLSPDAALVLAAVDEQIFSRPAAVPAGRWQYIYVHHSNSSGGSSVSVGADHFLIGNGNGSSDGEIQVGRRWIEQLPAQPVRAIVPEQCISICLVGDFDRVAPSRMQIKRLGELIKALRQQYGIPAGRVKTVEQPDSPAGIGKHFPREALPH